MKKTVIILSILVLASMTSCGQNNVNHKNMDSIKSQSLCVLEETKEQIIYLTHLVRIVQKAGDELKSYAGGDELFLRYETRIILKNKENHYTQEIFILHCVPERIAKMEGGSYDTYVYYVFLEVAAFYENGQSVGHAEPSGEWTCIGLDSDNGIPTKIVNYFYEHKEKIPVIQENVKR
jgi:hypothetical protein